MTFPCGPDGFTIDGPAGPLEALAACPTPDIERAATAVVLHPHPLHGGTLQNKVVHTIARTFTDFGARSVRFNFRGVGASAGQYGGGDGETDDALAVLRWARARRPDDALYLAGFSFGAYVALRAARAIPLAGVITVAPPVNLYDFGKLTAPSGPWVVMIPEADELVPAKGVRDWLAKLAVKPTVVSFPETSHYFHKRLNELREALVRAVAPLPARAD